MGKGTTEEILQFHLKRFGLPDSHQKFKMSGRQISTAISDLVLALSASLVVLRVINTSGTRFKMSGRQISTAVSDLVLAISAFLVALRVMSNHPLAAVGISLQGLAAFIGIFRFSMDPCDPLLLDAHKAASWLATLASLPGLATGFYNRFAVPYLAPIMTVLCGLSFLFGCYTGREVRKNIAEMFAGLSVLSVIVICLYHRHAVGLVACALYVLAGTVGAEGSFAGIPRVDILHYLLVLGNVAFMKALT